MTVVLTFKSGGTILLTDAFILGDAIVGKLADGRERGFNDYESARSI